MLFRCTVQNNHDSSNVNEGIRAVLFFYKKISHAQKAQKVQTSTKCKQATFLRLDVFYAHKKHKKHKKNKMSNKQFSSMLSFLFYTQKSTKST